MAGITVSVTLLAVMFFAGLTIFTPKSSTDRISRILGMAAGIVLVLALFMKIPIVIIAPVILILAGLMVYRNRENRANAFKAIGGVAAVVLLLVIPFNIYESNRMPVILKGPKSDIMDVNQAQSSSGTQIKLKKVLMDLKYINATYSVRGKEKVVAAELKKNPYDTAALKEITGLWIGRRLIGESAYVGMSYDADKFLDPVYLVFYLSNGDSIPFEIRDGVDAKSRTRIVPIDREIKFGESIIRLNKFYSALNYSTVSFDSNFMLGRNYEMTLSSGDSEVSSMGSSWGGSHSYQGSFYFDPVTYDTVTIKLRNISSGSEETFDLKIR